MAGKLSTYDVVLQAPAAIPASVLADQTFQYLKTGKWPKVPSATAFELLTLKPPRADTQWLHDLIAWVSPQPLWLTTLAVAILWAILFSLIVKRPGADR